MPIGSAECDDGLDVARRGRTRVSQDSWSELLQAGAACAQEEPGQGSVRRRLDRNEEVSL